MLAMSARMQNSVIYVPNGNVLILRDYSSSIRQMLHLLQQAENQLLPWGNSPTPAARPSTNTPGRRSGS
jgi:hypothetical protein